MGLGMADTRSRGLLYLETARPFPSACVRWQSQRFSPDVATVDLSFQGIVGADELESRLRRHYFGAPSLVLEGNPLASSLYCLRNFECLLLLNLRRCSITDEDTALLSTLRQLVHVDVSMNLLTSAGAQQLLCITTLQSLNVEGNVVGDDCVSQLLDHASLTHLNVGGTQLTSSGMACLLRSPRLTVVYAEDLVMDERGCSALENSRSIWCICLRSARLATSNFTFLTYLFKTCLMAI